MTSDSPNTADIVERLNATWKHDAYIATNRTSPPIKGEVERLVNPDGPEAGALIKELCEALKPLAEAARGLSLGVDWNNGTHAKTHGYRRKLLKALPAAEQALSNVSRLEG